MISDPGAVVAARPSAPEHAQRDGMDSDVDESNAGYAARRPTTSRGALLELRGHETRRLPAPYANMTGVIRRTELKEPSRSLMYSTLL